MASISVTSLGDNLFNVCVSAQTTTLHKVTVRPEYATNLLKPNESIAQLVERSFVFLLAREPNTSILRAFDLSMIGRYFPEYEQNMR